MSRHGPAIGMCFDRSFPASEVGQFARRLEVGGADDLWFIEDCFWTTAPPLAAAALAVTERLTVGLGILPAVSRPAAVTAMEIATLSSLAPGRVVAGIGHGVQTWMAQMGARTPSPLTTLDEVLTTVRRLLAGEEVTFDGRQVHLDQVRLEHAPDPVPPVLAGVRGPRSLAVAGRSADGLLLDAPCPAAYARDSRALAGAGEDFVIACFATMCVTPDRALSHRIMAPWLADQLEVGHPGLRSLEFFDDMAGRYGNGGAAALAAMPDDWWGAIGAIGTLEDAAAYVESLEQSGVARIAFFPAPDLDIARSQIDDVLALAAR